VCYVYISCMFAFFKYTNSIKTDELQVAKCLTVDICLFAVQQRVTLRDMMASNETTVAVVRPGNGQKHSFVVAISSFLVLFVSLCLRILSHAVTTRPGKTYLWVVFVFVLVQLSVLG